MSLMSVLTDFDDPCCGQISEQTHSNIESILSVKLTIKKQERSDSLTV